jgi:hypothetical protein
MAHKKTIRLELDRLAICFPYPERGEDEILELTEIWAEDLEDISDDVLKQAIKQVRRGSRFFPTVADVRSAAADVMSQVQPTQQTQLPEKPKQLSREEVERNKREAGKILEMLKHKKAM